MFTPTSYKNQPTSNGGDVPDKSPVVKAKTLPTCLGIVKGIWLGFSDGFVLVGSRWGLFFSKQKKGGPHFGTKLPTIKQHCVQNVARHVSSWKSGET